MKELLSKYLNSVCTPDEFLRLDKWISIQKGKGSLFQLLQPHFNKYLNTEVNDCDINHSLWEKIYTAISVKEKEQIIIKLRFYTLGFWIAAALLVALIVYNQIDPAKRPIEDQVVLNQIFTIPFGARSNLTLPDGSNVWINAGSELCINNAFKKNRIAYLNGEAYFEVIQNDLPFIVETAHGEVHVTGTAFNVKAYLNENKMETTVEQGTVVISNKLDKKQISIHTGQQATILDGRMNFNQVETDLFTSWREGKIIFRKEYLPNVAKRLERWYNVKIVLDEDPRLAKIHYTGTLEMESFSEVLSLLSLTASINYHYNDKTRVIKITHK